MKKEFLVFTILVLFILLNLVNIFVLVWFSLDAPRLTGRVGNSGLVSIFIEDWRKIYTTNPENITYNFSIGDNYTLDLEAFANFNIDTWWYDLVDERHGLTVSQGDIFTPNTTFDAVRWENRLIVYANGSDGKTHGAEVEFFVNVPNSAPVIHYIDPEILACEEDYISYFFNVTDVDEDVPTGSIVPSDFIYLITSRSINNTVKAYEIFSGVLTKSNLGGPNVGSITIEENVSVNDGMYVDSRQTNITIIEINNAPEIENIGVQTIWGMGEDTNFSYELGVVDIEDGAQDSGNFSVNLTILNSSEDEVDLFDIDNYGIINFTANETHLGVYNVSVFVTDLGLQTYHPNITNVCGETPYNKTSWVSFILTITDENRAPYITSYYPLNQSLTVYEGNWTYFNATMYDPDWNLLDTYWYVDERLIRYIPWQVNGSFSEVEHRFNYNDQGNHTITVIVTDGMLNDTFIWNISVLDQEPPFVPEREGGGGSSQIDWLCIEKWGCSHWNECKNAKDSLEMSILLKADYPEIKIGCDINSWKEDYCGFQVRNCTDVNECNSTYDQPPEMQACYYTENPSCFDGIKNCHDDSCELLVDCGGPCKPCPTCSDKVRNQGEEGVDCGGPCASCDYERPLIERPFRYILVTIILILLIIVIIISVRYLRFKGYLKKSRRIGKI